MDFTFPMDTKTWRGLLRDVIFLAMGCAISSLSIVMFLKPFQIAPTGVSGIATILNYLVGSPIGLVILLGNIPILWYAYRVSGSWRSIAYTIIAVVLFSVSVDVLDRFVPNIVESNNALLYCLFGSIVDGIGTSFVNRVGGTMGGTSTLARIFQQKWGLPLSSTYFWSNILIVVLAGFAYGSWEAALYAIIVIVVSGAATDYIIEGPSVIRTAVIVTTEPDVVGKRILSGMGRGATAWQAEGMYTHQQRTMIYVTVSRPQINQLRQLVFEADPNAFMVIGQGHAAYGHGFRKPDVDTLT